MKKLKKHKKHFGEDIMGSGANINGKLIKNIWNEVSFAGYMYCG